MRFRVKGFDLKEPIPIPKPSNQISIKTTKSLQTRQIYNLSDGENTNFRAENLQENNGYFSPPLWKTKTLHLNGNFQNLMTNSRAQAIDQGHREMMDIVKSMPESSYELSLKDIVDNPTIECEKIEDNQKKNVIERSGSGGKMRSTSRDYNGGMLLKMGKKKELEKVNNPKITPKLKNSNKNAEISEKDWSKKKSFSVFDSSHRRSMARNCSIRDNNSSRREKRGCSPVFFSLSFLPRHKNKHVK